LNRRNFLHQASRGLAALWAAPWLGISGCGNSNSPSLQDLSPLPWDALARALQGELLFPDAPEFESSTRPWNLRFLGLRPMALARCVSVADVRACLLWAQQNQVPLVARSGGHSYAAYSLTSGLMIDISGMRNLELDPVTGLARVAGGARNATLYAALRGPSRAVTHGRCREVGVGGLVLGGGIGFNMRARGLTCDQLVETDIVLASGEVLTCSENQNSDLFWACRGAGGGNFGIHTSFTFQTFPVSNLTVYQITWTTQLRQVLEFLIDTLLASPASVGCKVSVLARPGQGLQLILLGQIVGTAGELDALLAPVFQLAAPSISDVRTVSYWDGQDFLSEEGDPEFVHERSRYIFGKLSEAGLDTIFQQLGQWPGTSVSANWKFFLMGGAVAAKSNDATAYVHRQATMISSIDLEWSATDSTQVVAANQAWLNQFHQAMLPFTSNRCYQNFIDDSQSDFLQAYYGENLARLIEVKRKYDPKNVFRYPQSIPTGV